MLYYRQHSSYIANLSYLYDTPTYPPDYAFLYSPGSHRSG